MDCVQKVQPVELVEAVSQQCGTAINLGLEFGSDVYVQTF